MKTGRLVAVLAALLACSSAGVMVLAGEEAPAAAAPALKTVEVQVKQYRDVDADSVYQAAQTGFRVDVRFKDTFVARIAVPRGLEQVSLGPISYPIALAFGTRTDLICLVPGSNLATLGQLLGVPSDVLLGPADLARPLVLNQGQQVTIEGTVLGTVRGQKYVLVESVIAGLGALPPARREVHLFWPSQAEPRIITEPGKQTFEFPCTRAAGKTDKLTVTVDELTPGQLDTQLAALEGMLEGISGGRKVYGQYDPRTVYRYAGAGQVIDVDFTDQVQNILEPPPRSLASAPAIRMGFPGPVPIVRAFEMAGRPTILIPDTWPTVLQQSGTLIPGETVRVLGTTVGRRDAYSCVLVDFLLFPAQAGGADAEKPWWVSIQWEGVKQSFAVWDYGQYTLAALPCQNAPGQFEMLNVLVSQFRQYQVPQLPAAPAPAAAPNPAPQPNPAAPKTPAAAPAGGGAVVPKIETGSAPARGS